jgi:hypothetical protein
MKAMAQWDKLSTTFGINTPSAWSMQPVFDDRLEEDSDNEQQEVHRSI